MGYNPWGRKESVATERLLCVCVCVYVYKGFPGGSDSKAPVCNAGNPGSVPELGRLQGFSPTKSVAMTTYLESLIKIIPGIVGFSGSSVVSDSATPRTVAYQAPPSMDFSRQEYQNGLPFPSPGGFS